MRPHPKIRKSIRWGGAAVTALLMVVWIGSHIGWASWVNGSRSWAITVARGCVIYQHDPWFFGSSSVGHSGWIGAWDSINTWTNEWPSYGDYGSGEIGKVPLWLFGVATLSMTVIAWHLDTVCRRRAKLNLCAKCGYNRTGLLQDAQCPECGAAPGGV